MKAPLSYVPALPAAIGMMAGIVVFYLSGSCLWFAFAAICGVAAMVVRRYMAAFIFLFAVMGWLFALADKPADAPKAIIDTTAVYTGEITSVRQTSSAVRLTVDTQYGQLHFLCSLLSPDAGHEYRIGDSLSFKAKLHPVDFQQDLPDENSFNPTAFVDGVTAEAYVSPDDLTVTGSRGNLRRTAANWREQLRDLIYLSPVSSNAAWFLSATLLGDDSMLDPDLRENFRATGVAHYLALSGFHVGIIAMLAGLLLFPLKTWSSARRYRHLAVIALIWIYVVVCGMSASLVRAAVLISIFLLAKVLGRQSTPYNSLCIAAIVILAFAPRQLFAPGFQLSFAAVLSILLISPLLNPFSRKRHKAYTVASFFTVPVAAMTGTCLITMVHFHRLPLLFLLPNLLLGLLMPVVLTLGIVMMAATACGIRLSILGWIVNVICDSIERLCDSLASLPYAEITGIFPSGAVIVMGVITLSLLILGLYRRRPATLIAALIAGIITVASTAFAPALPDSELIITRRPLRTDIIVRHRDRCLLITSADSSHRDDIIREMSLRYRNYLSRRNCAAVPEIAPDTFDIGPISRRGDYLIFADKVMLMSPHATTPVAHDIHVDYLLITRQSGPRALEIIESIQADTILLAADLPRQRTDKLINHCNSNRLTYKLLTQSPFTLSR